MSSYLREMNHQVWWMVDVDFSHALEDYRQTQVQEKCLYLKVHASKALSSASCAEVEDIIEMEHGLLESVNLLWKALSKCMAQVMMRDHHQQMYQRISHHHLCTLIKIKKSNQVSKKKRQSLLVWENQMVWFPKPEYPILTE
jgi:hypothetical protein